MTAATISEWRDKFLGGGEARLKYHEVAVEDEETRRLKNVVADLATEKDLTQREDSPLGGQPPFGLVEVEAMSGQTSPSTHDRYGITRVLRVWELPRSTFYAQRYSARSRRRGDGVEHRPSMMRRCSYRFGWSSLTVRFTAKGIGRFGRGSAR